MFAFFKRKINLNKVLICIGQEYHDDRYSLPYVDDLIKYFVIEDVDGFKILSNKDFNSLNISDNELVSIGLRNTKKKIFSMYKEIPVQYNEENEVIIPYDADVVIEKGIYNFWTSLVLMPEIWDKKSPICINEKWEKYYVAMPYRTFLLIGNFDNIKSKKEILSQIEAYKNATPEELDGDFEASKRKISTKLYVIEDGKLKLYE